MPDNSFSNHLYNLYFDAGLANRSKYTANPLFMGFICDAAKKKLNIYTA